jgi:hypothetical protein
LSFQKLLNSNLVFELSLPIQTNQTQTANAAYTATDFYNVNVFCHNSDLKSVHFIMTNPPNNEQVPPTSPTVQNARNANVQMAALALKFEQIKIPEFLGQKRKYTIIAMA